VRDVGIEAVENRLAETDRHARGHDVHASSDRIAVATQRVDQGLELRHARRFGAEERVLVDRRTILQCQRHAAHLREVAENRHTLQAQVLARDGARRHAHDGLARR
jgi:hypothetical protein